MDSKLKKELLKAQRAEITEHFIYQKLSQSTKDQHNKKVLADISKDELKHYNLWKKFTKIEVTPDKCKISQYYFISKIFGLTFGIKLMEKGEQSAQINYDLLSKSFVEAKAVMADEEKHEKELISLLEEEKLSYIGSIVLGLNDALVELTGALAGFTLALQNSRLIAVIGLITGFAASLSMAASEYLSTTTESSAQASKQSSIPASAKGSANSSSANSSPLSESSKHPFRASVYTGLAYVLTVIVLVLPFFLLSNVYLALGWTLTNALLIILFFTFYVSIAQGISFKRKFLEMACISLGVATVTFIIGYLIRMFFGIDV